MANRTTSNKVKAIMDNCPLTNSEVDGYIVTANVLVTKVFSGDTTLGDTLLAEIEKWLTAHLIASTRHRVAAEEAVGDAKVKYTGKWGEGLKSTPYGQMVLDLDTTGKIAAIGKRKAEIYSITSFD